jgi:uncharacterized coiled-coil DUF342 family protein
LAIREAQTELRAVNKEIDDLRTKLAKLKARKAELERAAKT